MTSFNCFRDCLCCHPQEDKQEHQFKLKKKGLNCITSDERRGKVSIMPTQSSRFTDGNKFSEIKLKKYVFRNSQAKKMRSVSPQSNCSDGVRSYINSDIPHINSDIR